MTRGLEHGETSRVQKARGELESIYSVGGAGGAGAWRLSCRGESCRTDHEGRGRREQTKNTNRVESLPNGLGRKEGTRGPVPELNRMNSI